MVKVALVVPCLNEEEGLPGFWAELTAAVGALDDAAFTVIFVDDGSSDGTWEVISSLPATPTIAVSGVRLTRNFGHQNAIWCGLEQARDFDAVISLDADLQDPPQAIPEMLAKWRAGALVVTGVRSSRPKSDGRVKTFLSSLFYRFIGKLDRSDGERLSRDAGDFRLIDRRALHYVLGLGDQDLYLRGSLPWFGFREDFVSYARADRLAGHTKFSLTRMLRFAGTALLPRLITPAIKLTGLLGVAGLLLFLAVGVYVLSSLASDGRAPGWASTILLISLFGSLNLLGTALLGIIVARVSQVQSARPRAVIVERFASGAVSGPGGAPPPGSSI